jgi:hypothetical protein
VKIIARVFNWQRIQRDDGNYYWKWAPVKKFMPNYVYKPVKYGRFRETLSDA